MLFTSSLHVTTSGTLVILVPTKAGLVFAADSRSVINVTPTPIVVDTTHKIRLLNVPYRTALAVTGTGVVHACPIRDISVTEFLAQDPLLNMSTAMEMWFNAQPDKRLKRETVRRAAMHSCDVIRASGIQMEQFRGVEFCRVVLGHYWLDQQRSIVASWRIVIDENLAPAFAEPLWLEFRKKDATSASLFGATEFLDEHLFKSGLYQGLAGQSDTEVNAIFKKRPVSEISTSAAESYADLIIKEAEKLMVTHPYRFAVGGPVDAVLLCTDGKPQTLRMKSVEG